MKECCEKCDMPATSAPVCTDWLCFCHKKTIKPDCCDKPRKTISKSTKKGTRAICNSCGVLWKFQEKASPHSSIEVESWEEDLNRMLHGWIAVEDRGALMKEGEAIFEIEKLKNFIRETIAQERIKVLEVLESARRKHFVFECNGAHGGKGCYETWCEGKNCTSQDAEEVVIHNNAIDTILHSLKNQQNK